jgi:hypothetical protein
VRGKLARDDLLIQQLSAVDIQRVWRSHAQRRRLLELGGAFLLPTRTATSGEEGNAETLRLLSLDMQVRSLTILRDVLDQTRVVFGQKCSDLRSFFRVADRSGKGALDRNEIQHALQRLDLGISSGQLSSLVGTLWDAAPMSPREISSASVRTNQIQDDGQSSPAIGSPAVLSSLLLDSVTEDEFVAWAEPCRVMKALFVLRRRQNNQPSKHRLEDRLATLATPNRTRQVRD